MLHIIPSHMCSWYAHPAYPRLRSRCEAVLLAKFGDAQQILSDAYLLQEFSGLTFQALQVWGQSDGVAVDSEASVLVLLHSWANANRTAADDLQLNQLPDLLRVMHLSFFFRQHIIIPSLWWCQGSGVQEQLTVLNTVMAAAQHAALGNLPKIQMPGVLCHSMPGLKRSRLE